MGVPEHPAPSLGSLRPFAAGVLLATLGVAAHQVAGSALPDRLVAHTGAGVLVVACGLPPLPWASVDAMRWVTLILAILPLALGEPGALVALGIGPMLYGSALWSGLGDDRAHPPEPPAPPLRTAVGIGSGIAAIGGGVAWASVPALALGWDPTGGTGLFRIAIAGWLAVPGLALAACGAAGVAALRRARYARGSVRGRPGRSGCR